ncbi:MAG: tryptophan 2,3-dioxygenase family protein, partial [Planctomycetota bacterium]
GLEDDESALTDDEVLFITVHQVYELWFKLVLRQLTSVRDLLASERVAEAEMAGAVAGCRRVVTILRRCVDHFEVVETLPTKGYLSFRDKLMPASGFQSAQLRQIEILLGLDEQERIPLGVEGDYLDALRDHLGGESPAWERVHRQLQSGPSLREAFDVWLARTPIDGVPHDEPGSDAALDAFVARYLEAQAAEVEASRESASSRAMGEADRQALDARYDAERAALSDFLSSDGDGGALRRRRRAALLFIVTFDQLPLLAWPSKLVQALIELEQAFLLFRQRHARMVERVIGRRTGTGGSSGVDYLDQTALRYRVFRDLWAIPTYQIRAEAAPPLARPEFFGFASEVEA